METRGVSTYDISLLIAAFNFLASLINGNLRLSQGFPRLQLPFNFLASLINGNKTSFKLRSRSTMCRVNSLINPTILRNVGGNSYNGKKRTNSEPHSGTIAVSLTSSPP